MAAAVFTVGVLVAIALNGLLLVTLARPRLRFWPTPGPGSWQSYAFWPLFRGLNVLCFVMALYDLPGGTLGLPSFLRWLAFIVLTVSVAIFLYAFRVLGRDNSYGARDGLVIGGIYQWTRNPQNAMLIVVYGALALAVDAGPTYVLCAGMMAGYTLMVLAEEPWLADVYGEPYRHYRAQVPRFFAWRRATEAARNWLAASRHN